MESPFQGRSFSKIVMSYIFPLEHHLGLGDQFAGWTSKGERRSFQRRNLMQQITNL